MRCNEQIKEQERNMLAEIANRKESETAINQQRQQNNQEDIFMRILEKSIFMKARDKMKQGKKKNEDDSATIQARDYLAPIIKKLGIQVESDVFDDDIAMQVKNEALRSLKERLLTRADIIQSRLEDEQKKLEDAYNKLKRKGDTLAPADQESYEKEVANANFRMDILTERASQHYKNSLDKFQELDEKLKNDVRLQNLNKATNI